MSRKLFVFTISSLLFSCKQHSSHTNMFIKDPPNLEAAFDYEAISRFEFKNHESAYPIPKATVKSVFRCNINNEEKMVGLLYTSKGWPLRTGEKSFLEPGILTFIPESKLKTGDLTFNPWTTKHQSRYKVFRDGQEVAGAEFTINNIGKRFVTTEEFNALLKNYMNVCGF